MFPFLFITIPSTNDAVSPAKSSFAESGFVIMVEVWLVLLFICFGYKITKKETALQENLCTHLVGVPNACVKKSKRRNHPLGV